MSADFFQIILAAFEKIHAFFNQEWPGVVRTKGFFWLCSRPDFVGEVSQAGAFVRHRGIGRWWAAIPKSQWPDGNEFENIIKLLPYLCLDCN